MRKILIAAVLVAGLATPVIAASGDTSMSAATPTAVTNDTAEPEPEMIVCRTMAPVVGTRLGATRQCTSQREWDRIRRDSQTAVERTQNNTPVQLR